MKFGILVTRRRIVNEIAENIAEMQKKADEIYYKDNPPKEHLNEMAAYYVGRAYDWKDISMKLGICDRVYKRAYEIYDFRNSGRTDYILKDGKIVKAD